MLQIKDIHKQYKTGSLVQKALDGVSLTFRDNEFVAILGPSGSGKTTLLNIVGGLDRYDSGDLIINGKSTKKYTDRDWDTYRNHSIGFVFQSYNLISHQSVLQNVELALTISGISKAERRKRAVSALKKVGLGDQLHKKPNQMSGGQMQRVAIARALVNDPDILLADEPTGALDTQTGVQVMELLKEVARDRLVIMVTHNADLAQQYATRIVTLQDGRIVDDSDPAMDTDIVPAVRNAEAGKKPSMSFRTSLGLSFRNLLTKKRRTLTTAFAGSIGIIGIALILSLSSGVNAYIQTIEEDTLAEYPLQITNSEFDLTSLMASMTGTTGTADDTADSDAEITVMQVISTMLSQVNANDLTALKEYIDSGESGLEDYVTAIEYVYDLEPEIYLQTEDGVQQVNPDTTMRGAGGSLLTSLMTSSVSSFYALPESKALYQSQYEVVAGHWPESYNECVLVLTEDGSISDYLLYTLGLRDYSELEDMIRQYSDGENVSEIKDIGTYAYADVLGVTYKVVCSAGYYAYDEEYDLWVDKTDNEAYLTELVENGEDLTIVGVVQPSETAVSAALSSGIYYSASLIEHMAGLAAESDAGLAQLADPDVNIFTGEEFGEDGSSFDMESMLSVDEDALTEAFSVDDLEIDTSSLQLDASDLTIDTSSLELDLSSLDLSIDTSALESSLSSVSLDTSSLNLSDYLDLSAIDLSAADLGSLELDLSDMDLSTLLAGLTVNVSAESTTQLAADILDGYPAYLESSGGDSYGDLTADLASYLESAEAAEVISTFLNEKLQDCQVTVPTAGLTATIEAALGSYAEADAVDAAVVADAVSAYLNTAAEVSVTISDDDIAALTSALVSGYGDYAQSHSLTTAQSIQDSFTAYLASDSARQLMSQGLLAMVDWTGMQTQLSAALESYMQTALSAAMTSYTEALTATIEAQMSTAMEQMAAEMTQELSAQVSQQMSAAMEQMMAQMEEELTAQISGQMSTAMDAMTASLLEQVNAQLSESMEAMMEEMASSMSESLTQSLTIDADALSDTYAFNMDVSTLTELLTSISSSTGTDYDSNLSALGYVDFETPSEIDIYPKDFAAKDEVVAILDDYNDRMEESGKSDQVISYTDLVGTMMSSVTTIINLITYVLIAFVAISLVVSCIMISIITQISVLERTKEIGILRAIGASKRNISQVFNAETFIIGISSGLIGILLSELLLIPINALIHALAESDSVNAILPWGYALLLVVVSIVITVLSGLAPAHSAAKKDPVIALRSE